MVRSGTDITGRPGDGTMEMNGGSTASYLARTLWEPVDPIVADPVRQDNDKRNGLGLLVAEPLASPFYVFQ